MNSLTSSINFKTVFNRIFFENSLKGLCMSKNIARSKAGLLHLLQMFLTGRKRSDVLILWTKCKENRRALMWALNNVPAPRSHEYKTWLRQRIGI